MLILKLIWKCKTQNSQNIPTKKKTHTSGFQNLSLTNGYQDSVVLEQLICRQKNKIENSEIRPYIYCQLIYKRGSKTIQWGENVFSANSYGTTE